MAKKTKEPRPSIPMPTRVQEDEEFRPIAASLEGKFLHVESIDDREEEEAGWWEPEPVWKMQYQVPLEDGRSLRVWRNMRTRPSPYPTNPRDRYCNASARWFVSMPSDPARSAIVRATLRTLW